MSEVWVQIIAACSGLVTTLAVKYLEHVLKRRSALDASTPDRPTTASVATEET